MFQAIVYSVIVVLIYYVEHCRLRAAMFNSKLQRILAEADVLLE